MPKEVTSLHSLWQPEKKWKKTREEARSRGRLGGIEPAILEGSLASGEICPNECVFSYVHFVSII